MKIRFRDVPSGIVQARAVIEILPGVYLNEVTIIQRDGELKVEIPQKTFIGKTNKKHYIDILTFDSEDKRTLWEMDVKEEYETWREGNKKILVYSKE
ncbi:MAG: hypothetical protein P9L91_07450 [Candidatus Zophobacter franzmannii]|nr:hypothetical protein [Candidatus Zophobacter franzmannii]